MASITVTVEIIDPNQRKYHTSSQISDFHLTCYFHSHRPIREDDQRLIGGAAILLVKNVLTIPGIDEVDISKDTLTVFKKKSGQWQEIEPQIIGALKRAIGPDVEVVYPEVSEKEPPKSWLKRVLGR